MTIQSLKSSLALPVIASPMFLVSGVDLVVECCKNGIVGTFPSLNGRTSEDFERMLTAIENQLEDFEQQSGKKATPFGVNLIVHKSNHRLYEDLEICIRHQVPIVITSLGAVSDLVERIHAYGGLVFHDVIKKRHAEKAAEAGVDGIICVAAGAGGHAGTAHPFALIKEIRSCYTGAIILAGSVNSGNEILATEILNADFAYMGTRFINTKESMVSDDYRKMIVESEIGDVIYTDKVSGVHGNFLLKSIEKSAHDLEKDKHGELNFLKNDSSKAWKDIWSAGHGVTAIHDILSVETLVQQLRQEYETAKRQITEK